MTNPFTLSPLPFDESALAPAISDETVRFHYGKHHKTYVATLNTLVAGTRFADMKLEDVVRATAAHKSDAERKIFNNASQVWNHDFYWQSLSPDAQAPGGKLAEAIARDFAGTDDLVGKLAEAGKEQFGSGWVWLVSQDGKLSIAKTSNAESPMAKGQNCLLAIDVWEHAYYLDYQNARDSYLKTLLARLINWSFAEKNLAQENHPVRAGAE